MGMSLFRFIAALGRTLVVANTFGFFVLLLVYVLGGFIIAKGEPQLFFCTLYSIGKIKCMTETNISFTQATVSKMVHATSIISFTDNLEPWMKWGYYISPMMYGQNAIAINEFLDERWSAVRSLTCGNFFLFHFLAKLHSFIFLQPNTDHRIPEPTVGKALLRIRSMFTEDYWYWISIGALLGFSLLFNICFIIALTFLNRKFPHCCLFLLLP